jgi:phage tail protein X
MQRYITSQGDTLDAICWKYYGQQSGAVERVLEANPNLADLGVILPLGTTINLPALPKPAGELQPIRLWS